MTSVTGLTASRMEEIEASSIVDGEIVGDDLILKTRNNAEINAGNVRGPRGLEGQAGPPGVDYQGSWSGGTTYAINQWVSRNGKYYWSKQNSNTNHDPATDSTETWWVVSWKNLSDVIDAKRDYGITFDGTTDDTAAWQALAADLSYNPSPGIEFVWVHIPRGVSRISSTIDFTHTYGVQFTAHQHGGYDSGDFSAEIEYVGATGPMFDFLSSDGIVLEGITFSCNNASFKDDLVVFDNSTPSGSGDCIYCRIYRCGFRNRNGTPKSLLRLNHAVIDTVEQCHFYIGGGFCGLMLGNYAIPGGVAIRTNQESHYTNAIQIKECSFNSATMAHIWIAATDIEQLSILDCTFESCPGYPGVITPTGLAATPVGSGGSFAAGTYYWKVGATKKHWHGSTYETGGETLPCAQVSQTVINDDSVTLECDLLKYASSYRFYRSSSSNGQNVSPALVHEYPVNWRGRYVAGTTYAKDDVVQAGNYTANPSEACYISLSDGNVGNNPKTDGGVHWALKLSYLDTGAAPSTGAVSDDNYTQQGGAISGPYPMVASYCHMNIERCWGGDAAGTDSPWVGNLRSHHSAIGRSRLVGCYFDANVSENYTIIPAIAVEGGWTLQDNYVVGQICQVKQSLVLTDMNNVGNNINGILRALNPWVKGGSPPGIYLDFVIGNYLDNTFKWGGGPVALLDPGQAGIILKNGIYQCGDQSRWLGARRATTPGYPTDSRFGAEVGDWVGPDPNGQFWVCVDATTAPGIWVPANKSTLINSQSGDYTFTIKDHGCVVEGTGGSAHDFTMSSDAAGGWKLEGQTIKVFQVGTGQITIVAGSTVTLQSNGNKLKTAGQFAEIELRKRTTNTWSLSGDLAA